MGTSRRENRGSDDSTTEGSTNALVREGRQSFHFFHESANDVLEGEGGQREPASSAAVLLQGLSTECRESTDEYLCVLEAGQFESVFVSVAGTLTLVVLGPGGVCRCHGGQEGAPLAAHHRFLERGVLRILVGLVEEIHRARGDFAEQEGLRALAVQGHLVQDPLSLRQHERLAQLESHGAALGGELVAARQAAFDLVANGPEDGGCRVVAPDGH
eukprot:scaffold5733_cov54-Attheya_sp.AAC.1